MENQKLDNQLNLAMQATQEELDKSIDLDVGFNEVNRTWDVIVKYSGDLDSIRDETISITPLLNQYAVVRIQQNKIGALANLPQIEYVEKPKRLFFAVNQGRAASCMNVVQTDATEMGVGQTEDVRTDAIQVGTTGLHGRGVLVACVDSGIDYSHPDFRNPDGSTRLIGLWDQTVAGNLPEGYFLGSEYTSEQINEALQQDSLSARYAIVPSRDLSSHGTAVMGIAAGKGRGSDGIYRGVATESDLLMVKLATPLEDSFPRTTELIQGIDYCIRTAIARNQPLALNLSFGNSYGSHEGNSLVETYLNQVSNLGRTTICVGMGNEGDTRGHTAINLDSYSRVDVELLVGTYQTSFNIQIWKSYTDDVDISIIDPTGAEVEFLITSGAQRYRLGDTNLLIYYGMPSPYSAAQEIYIDLIPTGAYVDTGIWTIRFTSQKVVDGSIDLWLPGGGVLNEDTHFYTPTPDRTLTIPAAAAGVISVGAYNSQLQAYASFSGRGYTRVTNQVKPDLVAPGVNITAPKSGGGYAPVTGTSFATPFVTGAAALMMEYGIIRGASPYLYGEAVKANLRRGARQLDGFTTWPNPQMGYGALCLQSSLPTMKDG